MKKTVWHRFMNQFSIKNKLLFSLIPVIILSYLFLVFTADMLSFRETQHIVNDQADINMKQKSMLVDSYLNKIQTETEFFMFDAQIQKRLRIKRTDLSDADKEVLDVDMRQYMYNIIINYDNNVQGVCVTTFQNDSYLWKMDGRDPYNQFLTRIVQLESSARKLDGKMFLSYERLSENLITVSRIISDPITKQELGLLMIDFNLNFLQNAPFPSDTNVDPVHAIMTADGKIVYNSSPLEEDQLHDLDTNQNRIKIDDANYRIYINDSTYSDWKIIGLLNETAMYANIIRIYSIQIGLLLLSLFIIIGLIVFTSHTISQQFQLFIKKINQTTNIEDHAMICIDSKDEFRDLADVYNEMLKRIRNLIDTIYSKELLLKNAEIKALQAQINPHFLYNTLDCINGLVELNRPSETKKTVAALAKIMRMSIKGREFLTVRENIEYIDEFMYIEKMRYQDKILFLEEVPDSMMDYMMPKLILQPVLENSVIHGISEIMEQGMIGLFGYDESDALVFCVKDNGLGIPQSIIDSLSSDHFMESSLHLSTDRIGLMNIQARIQLLYGPAYGISIENLSPVGSCVTIRLPKICKGEHDEHSDC